MEAIWSIIEVETQRILPVQCASEHRIKKWLIAMSETIIKAFRFSFKPNKTQSQNLDNTLRLCKDLYNAALQERKEAYSLNRISINYQAQQNQLPDIKQTNPEYKEIHSQILQNVLKRVDLAFQGFFSRVKKGVKAGFPRFRSISRYDSFTFPQSGFSLSGNKLTLSKIGTVKLKLSRKIQGKVKTCQIKREIDKWFVIFTVETATQPLPKTGEEIGIDAGVVSFLTLSDGSEIENNRFYQSTQKQLRVAQRAVSRKKKGGANRRKAVLKLRKIHQKIKNQRADYQHKISNYLVKTYDVICIEKLNLSGMVKSRLGKSLSDVAIGNFYRMLKCKAENADKRVIEIPAHFTSQTCSACGHCEKANRLSQAEFVCLKCNHNQNADWNAAKNILRLGKSALGSKWNNSSCLPKESLTITVSV